MKRIYYVIALLALIDFTGFGQAQTPGTINNSDAPLAYCIPGASLNVQCISSVRVGSIYNITGWSPGGYIYYSSLWTSMTVGTGYPISVTNGFGYSTDQCAIWVDWNKDTDFTDAGEQITVTGTPGIGPYTATITAPAGTTTGTTRMRVRIASTGTFNSCGTTLYGETEDYAVNINGTPPTTDIGVIDLITPVTGTSLGANETVKVRICNFGTVAQSNFTVSYKVNEGTIVTETVINTIVPGATYDYIFAQKANLEITGAYYSIHSYTNLSGDQNVANDSVTRSVFHAWAQNQKVVQGEYFINTDPGEGNGIAIAGTYNLVDITVNITNLNLPVGSRVYLRFKSQNGKWSLPRSFRRENYLPNMYATLSYAEYFLNIDPGQGNGTPASISNGNINLANLNVPVASKIYFRVKDSYNRWSQPIGIERLGHYTMTGAELQTGEYFIDNDPGQGNGTQLTFSGGVANLSDFNLPVGSVVYIRVKDSYNRWGYPKSYKRPAIINTWGSDLAAVEYFINTDPGQGNGIQLPITTGTVHIDSLELHQHDVVFIRAKDSFNRWGPPKAWKYHFKDFQKAEYKIKLASNGTTTQPMLMQLIQPPDSTCGWIGKRDTLNWHTNDTIWTRFQDQDGFYTNWKRGVVANAGMDVTICEGGTTTLTATGGGSYLWNTGQAGPVIQVYPLFTTKYWVEVTDGAGAFSTDTVLVMVSPLPFAPGPITGLTEVCAGITATVYTVAPVLFATSYIWTLPPGATGASNTNSIQVTFGPTATSGNILVRGSNACGQGSGSYLPIVVNASIPGPAGTISGNSIPCKGDQVIYSIAPISNASTYFWTLPSGASGYSATNSITVNFGNTAVDGNISVIPQNSCGNGTGSIKSITLGAPPAAPSVISGPNEVCAGITSANYTITPVASATAYIWTLPYGATGNSSTNSILITYGTSAVSGNLLVKAANACGTGPDLTTAITVNTLIPGAAGAIAGMNDVCAGASVTTYTTPIIPNATSYFWTVPPGALGSSATNSISVSFGSAATSGMITVNGVNSCGQGQPSSFSVQVNNCAAGPAGFISGTSVVSPGMINKIYSVEQISNATSYIWTIPEGSSIISGFNTNSIAISYSDTANSGIIQVNGANACGNGLSSPAFYVTVTKLVPLVREVTNLNIFNGETECYDATQTVYVAGNNTIFTVDNGGIVNVIAGENVIIKPLTKVYSGGHFHALITTAGDFCNPVKSFLASDYNDTSIYGANNKLAITPAILVYPNPTTGKFTLEFSDSSPLITKVAIFGMRGEKVLEKEAMINQRMVISIEGNRPGIYFIHTLRNNQVYNSKVIIQ